MIPVKKFKRFWEYMADVVGKITLVFVVSDESEMIRRIENVNDGEFLLVAVIPSSNSDLIDQDNYKEIENPIVYVLKKSDASNLDEDDILQIRHETQELMTAIKKEMIRLAGENVPCDEYTSLMENLCDGKIHTDPEYNYLGCTGWSFSFDLKTDGFAAE